MIEGKKVCLTYPDGTMALKNVDLQIQSGDIVYITGPSGSGKTSLLKLMMGMEYPTTGFLKVMGQAITKDQAASIRRLRRVIGPVFQEFKLIKGRTVIENVMLGMRFLGIPPRQLKENANHALIKVGLEHKALSPVENLSWGESQRVAIARAVARKPALILADEPTGNLDVNNAVNILELLTSFNDKKTTVVITTHATHLINDKKVGMFIEVDRGNIQWEKRG
ncbi:ATP-binding cassette domain-containing protein [Petroclostridium sp. X23]|uniref:cell division ATP-binding protein FtsE n=1 Tax=Petroclostridium sp. X23 TaxID=3045146 RepID=UPI0024AE6993|nr:ATP-binding cassette domain-containing protein [Petroclostridium sp. X23]WHH57870.1 ATP-binding cassette domain-containing protein [Petroclostridium sp. X23]